MGAAFLQVPKDDSTRWLNIVRRKDSVGVSGFLCIGINHEKENLQKGYDTENELMIGNNNDDEIISKIIIKWKHI